MEKRIITTKELEEDLKIEKSLRPKFLAEYIGQEKAKEKGVRLLVMIAADKYDIYQNHIVDNPFPVKTNNEDIERIIGRRTSLLLTKRCLLPFIDKEEKDIYMFNDTHWSYKASKIIADELYQRITRNEAGDYDG